MVIVKRYRHVCFQTLIVVGFTAIFLTTSLCDYVLNAPLYVKSVIHELTYKELRFSCNKVNNLASMAPDVYVNYTQRLNSARNKIIQHRISYYEDKLVADDTGKVTLLQAESTEDYQREVDALGHVITVKHTCRTPTCGLPEVTGYKWGVSAGLCPSKMDDICDDVPAHPVEHSLEEKVVSNPPEQHSKPRTDFYMHLIPNGTIGSYGSVQTGNTIIIPRMCISHKPPVSVVAKRKEKEVFVVTQFWGEGWYHGSIEDIPRLAAYVEFLKENPQIKIHSHARSPGRIKGYLALLGLDLNRVVKGPMQAEVVYLPQGGGCGQLHQPSGYLLTAQFHTCMANWTVENPTTGHLAPAAHLPRNLVILIKRSFRRNGRELVQFNLLEDHVKALAMKYGLEFRTFVDTEIPSFSEMVALFHRAVLIVGPHGAGLSNMIFSRPRTYIVEILCRGNVNLCYVDIASKLGMHYRGIMSKGQTCRKMEFDLGDMLYTLIVFLEDYKNRMNRSTM